MRSRRVLALLGVVFASAAIAVAGAAGSPAAASRADVIVVATGGQGDNYDWMPQPPDV